MALLIKKIRGATLFEALISMIIIMMCFGISLMIYLNLVQGENKRKKVNGNCFIDKLAWETKEKNNFTNEKIVTETLIIEKTVQPYLQVKNLSILTFIASDKNNQLVAKRRELITTP